MAGKAKGTARRGAAHARRRPAPRSALWFDALFAASPMPIIVSHATERRIVEINAAALRLLGIGRDEAIGAPTDEVARPRNRAHVDALHARALAGEPISGAPASFMRRDGARVNVLLSSSMVKSEGGPYLVVCAIDVTESERLVRARREADARYRALFETALDGFLIGTPEQTLLDANPAACAMTGYTRAELAGLHVAKLFQADDLAAKPLRRDVGRRWATLERVLARKDGGSLTVEMLAGPMPDGNVLTVMRDITERKRSEALATNIAHGVSAAVGAAFFQSLVEHLARELQADFAFIAEVLPGDRMRSLAYHADGAIGPEPEFPIEGSMSANALAEGRTVIYPRGVKERFADNANMVRNSIEAYVGTPLYGADGNALGVLAVGHRKPIERGDFWASMIEIFGARAGAEIERARAEALVRRTNESLEQSVRERTAQLEEANRDLESYNYSISHDLRQPLNAIAGFAELLREQAGGAVDEGMLTEIETNAARMEEMVDALLRLAQAGRGAINRGSVDSRALVESVLRDLAATMPPEAQVSLGELPPAQGDPALLRQVWANLIGNALKYSRQSAVPRVWIEGRRHGASVEFAVRDNGVGFDAQRAERIFEPFQRLPSARGFEGSGVGLAIVDRIVRRHGGSLRAESTPGHGATFRFTVPD